MKTKIEQTFVLHILMVLLCCPAVTMGYPIDGYEPTGIRRLARLQRILDGKMKGQAPLPGAQKSMGDIQLNLLDRHDIGADNLPAVDQKLQIEINALFPNRDESYSIAVLDISPGKPLRFAKRQAERGFAPGSVGKLAIAAGLFYELKNLFPASVEKRRELLKNRMVTAESWIHTDSHDVPVFNPDTGVYASRPLREGDVFSLYEWTDHMLSASANAAASTVWKELVLMRHFKTDYPPTAAAERAFFEKTPKKILTETAMSVVNDPLRMIGISKDEWQLGSFFTSAGKKLIPGIGGSQASPLAFMKYLITLEKGMIADSWSSLEIKRLMYMTARRIRYASSPSLTHATVYFKSGSLYRCKAEQGFSCKKYMGNVENVMNSVAIVEHPDGRIYLVALMSDVLRKNSAVEHQSIATFIDRILSR